MNYECLLWDAIHDDDIVKAALALKKLKGKDVRNIDKCTPLMIAAREGKTGLVDLFISHGTDVNARNVVLRTALIMAVIHGCRDVVKLLIGAKADVETKDEDGDNALHWAAWEGHIGITKDLLDAGADPFALDATKRLPVDNALEHGYLNTANAIKAKMEELTRTEQVMHGK